jgi:hypothetical protein
VIRKAKAVWSGSGRAGSGHLSSESGVLAETAYSFKTRFENEKGRTQKSLSQQHMPGASRCRWHSCCRARALRRLNSAPKQP